MMKTAILHEFGRSLRIDQVPRPEPGPGQALVRVLACGVCHTDLHTCRGDWRARPKLPLIPGHEIVGEIVALGSGVDRPLIGTRVGVFWLNAACGSCEHCGDGWESICSRQTNTGFTAPGGFAEYTLVNADFAIPVSDEHDPVSIAPLLCAGVSAYKAVKETGLKAGQSLAVVGIGGVGHLAVAYAKAAGLRVVAIDAEEQSLSLAREMGADETLLASEAIAVLKKSAHAAIVTAPTSGAIPLAVQLLRRNGMAILVGLPAGDASVPVFDVVVKRLTIRGSIGGSRDDVRAALSARILPRVLVRQLESVNDVFDEMRVGKIHGRVVLQIASAPVKSED